MIIHYLQNQFEVDNLKFIHTNNKVELIKIWMKAYPKISFISPLTKIETVLNFKAHNPLVVNAYANLDIEIQEIVNEQKLITIQNYLNSLLGIEIVDYKMDVDKILNHYFKVEGEYFNQTILLKYLKLLDQAIYDNNIVFIYDFDNIWNELKLLKLQFLKVVVISNFNNERKLIFSDLAASVIVNQKDCFEIFDVEKLIAWLELKSRTVLSNRDLNEYLNNELNYNTFVIYKIFAQNF